MTLPAFARLVPGGVELRVKVVPGASRATIAGALGDRLKLRVAAPPERGRANAEVVALIASVCGGAVELVSGASSPLKTVLVRDPDPRWRQRLDESSRRP